MAVFKGQLFTGTLPSGHVRSFEAGKCATYDQELPPGWRHIAAVRDGNRLNLYVDGKPVAHSAEFDPSRYNLSNAAPLQIGFGQSDYFNGTLRDVRIYKQALAVPEIAGLAQAR